LTCFQDFGLAEPITRALAEERYVTPTPIQNQTIPIALSRRDVIGIAQTGTGKTAAFALPILHHLCTDRRRPQRKACRVLVLSPTRELSGQILDSFRTYGRHAGISAALAIGGVSMGAQVRSLLAGVDVLVATPGRLLDLVGSNALRLGDVEHLVLDEADRMLDMGFIHDIRRIVAKLPAHRQTLFFSATMPGPIAALAGEMLRDPANVAVTPVASTVERVEQRVVRVERAAKATVLAGILRGEEVDRALVFTRTKHGADKVVRGLAKAGIAASAIHGNKSQNQRERVLMAFRSGAVRTLVATDIAARGIDVDRISHVVNFDLPNVPETYVHRIGRTARAGAAGTAISLCDAEEMPLLRDIEKLIRRSIPASDHRRVPAQHHRPVGQGRASVHRKHPAVERSRRPHDGSGQRPRRDVQAAPRARVPQEQPRDAPAGIAGVAFLQRAARPDRDDNPRRFGQGTSRG
jgi:superfamily II DNA/RNA helicase